MTVPEVSIVLTTRDRPDFAARALQSALAQTLEDLEVVVIDDASIEPFILPQSDHRVRLIRRKRSVGVCAARNAGLAAARGHWITFLDDDDLLLPHMLELSLRAAKESTLPSPVAVLSGMELVDDHERRLEVRVPMSLQKGKHYFLEGAEEGKSFTVANTLLVPIEILRTIGGFDESLRGSVHRELLLRLNGVCSIEGVSEITYRLTRHGGVHIHNNMLARAEAMEKTAAKHREVFSRHPRQYAHYLSSTGVAFLRAGKWGPAIRATTRALTIDWRRPKHWLLWMASLAGPRATSLLGMSRRQLQSAHRTRS